jgi:hypothetical protein
VALRGEETATDHLPERSNMPEEPHVVDAVDVDLRSAFLHLWDTTHIARPTWALPDRLLGTRRRGQLVAAGLIEQDPEFSGCWRFTDRGSDLARRFRPDDFPRPRPPERGYMPEPRKCFYIPLDAYADGDTYETAQATAESENARLGLTSEDVTEIILSSMRASTS